MSLKDPSEKKQSLLLNICFYIVVVTVLIHRLHVLKEFSFKFVDGDEAIMWLGLSDYSHGDFFEPRFYGQSYNTMLEALFAVPLTWCGLAPYISLPLITSLFTLTPFFALSFIVKRRSVFLASIILGVLLLLPVEYHMMTSMCRGFVPGLFIAGLASLLLFSKFKYRFILISFSFLIALSANSNSGLIVLPVLLLLLLKNRSNTSFYLQSLIGATAGGMIHLLIDRFYTSHPFYVVHGMSLDFSFQRIVEGISELGTFLNYNTPVFWTWGFLSLIIFLVIGAILVRSRKVYEATATFSIPILIILSLSLNKVWDGNNALDLPFARMYLVLPFLICLSLSFIDDVNPNFTWPCTIVLAGYFVFHLRADVQTIATRTSEWMLVTIAKVDDVLRDCRILKKVAEEHKAGLIVLSNHLYYDIYNYGCPACIENYPNTLRPVYERRTWRLIEDEKKVYTNVLVIETNQDLTLKMASVKNLGNALYLVKDNQLPTMKLLDTLDIKVRRYK